MRRLEPEAGSDTYRHIDCSSPEERDKGDFMKKRTSRGGLCIGLGGLALGAALAWSFDPQRGARRRAGLRQGAAHLGRELSEALASSAHDLVHRSRGLLAQLRSRLNPEPVSDALLTRRVRARLGRVCSHPGAVAVICKNGRVELRGPILKDEVKPVVRALCRVSGVREVDSHLEVHDSAAHIPALQGAAHAFERAHERWAPATRAMLGVTGAGLISWGLRRRGTLGTGAGLAGANLLVRSVTNLPTRRLVGIGAGPRAIDLQKVVHVNAPLEEVFAFFEHFDNFPRFMRHVRAVVLSGDVWRWTVDGPVGVPVSWSAQVIQYAQNQLIGWRSVEGSLIGNEGTIRFEPDRGGTRLSIRLSYNPPGGALGHALVTALGANPKRQLDDDLVRFKSLLEKGKATGRAERVTKEQVSPGVVLP